MRLLKIAAAVAALAVAGVAQAQEGSAPAPAPGPAPVSGPPAGTDYINLNERGLEFGRLDNEVSGRRSGPGIAPGPHPSGRRYGGQRSARFERRRARQDHLGRHGFRGDHRHGRQDRDRIRLARQEQQGRMFNMPKSRFDAILAGGKSN